MPLPVITALLSLVPAQEVMREFAFHFAGGWRWHGRWRMVESAVVRRRGRVHASLGLLA